MTLYSCVGAHAISPTGDTTVAPGETVELDPNVAAPYTRSGDLVLTPETPSPTKKETVK